MKRKIRVLQFTVSQSQGGRTLYVLNNWKHIDKTQFSFDFVTFSKELSFEKELIEQGCKVFHISCYYRENKNQFIKELDDVLKHGYDVIHIHTAYWENAIVEERAKEFGIPKIIVHSHSTGITKAKDENEYIKMKQTHYSFRDKMDFGLITDYCACSTEAGNWLFGDRVPSEKIRILHNAIDTNKYQFSNNIRKKMRETLGITDDMVLIGNVGRMVYVKNQELLIHLIPELSKLINLKLLLVGDGPLLNDYKQLAKKLHIEEHILFVGHRSDVEELLQAMDIYCMPSYFEGFSIALLEAQCAGLQCLISDKISKESIITDLVNSVPLSEELWIKEIAKTRIKTKERKTYAPTVKQMGFDINDQVKELERVYKNALVL